MHVEDHKQGDDQDTALVTKTQKIQKDLEEKSVKGLKDGKD